MLPARRSARTRCAEHVRRASGMRVMTNACLLALAAASLSTASASASVAPDDPIGDVIARSLTVSDSPGAARLWRPGERVGFDEWDSARSVDYRQRGLRQPPLGY